MRDYQVILFDLDGTLTEPKIGITKSVQYALAKFNIFEENLDKLVPFIGPPLMDSFQEFYNFTPEQARQGVAYYREYFSVKGMYENAVYPGITALLKALTQKGKKLIVATSKPTTFSEKILQHFALDCFFTAVVGSNLDGTRVEKTEIIQAIIEILPQVPKEKIIMIGDRKYDIIGAKNNQIASLAVTYGYGSLEELQGVNPHYLAHSVEELGEIIC